MPLRTDGGRWPGKSLAAGLVLAGLLLAGCAGSIGSESAGNGTFTTLQPAGTGSAGTGAVTGSLPAKTVSTAAATGVAPGKTATAAPPPAGSGAGTYKIGSLDVLEFKVFKAPDLSRTVQVADTGTANFPLVGEVPVVGRTVHEVEKDLAKQLGAKYLQRAEVTLLVKEFNSQRVTVEGAVKKPGVYPLRGHATLLQFVATAEGLDATASSELTLFRQQPDGTRAATHYNMSDIRDGTTPDPTLQAGDVIVVPASFAKQTFENFIKVLPVTGSVASKL